MLENKTCKKVKIYLRCPDKVDTEENKSYGKLGTSELLKRIEYSSQPKLNYKEKVKYKDSRGLPFLYEKKSVPSIPERELSKQFPLIVGKIELDKNSYSDYKKSHCAEFLNKVSTKFNKSISNERYRLFDDYLITGGLQESTMNWMDFHQIMN